MADIGVVIDKLHGFETANEIAEFLRGYGIKALPRKASLCAISEFVRVETDHPNVSTTSDSLHVYEDDSKHCVTYKSFNTDAMRDFVRRYDLEEYPDLIVDGYDFKQEWSLINGK